MKRAAALAALAVTVTTLAGCSTPRAGTSAHTAPPCEPDRRVAIVAQSVPGAAYVPCLRDLAPGWTYSGIDVESGGTSLTLDSDRADREVTVELSSGCDVGEATPVAPSDEGVRTYQLVESISPRYAGAFLDVFPGGCVTTRYDFERGPHLALVAELQAAVDLYSRRELRQDVERELVLTLDP